MGGFPGNGNCIGTHLRDSHSNRRKHQMKTWRYGINSVYETAFIDLQNGPWWVFGLERMAEWCCDGIPDIPLPKLKLRLRDPEDIEANDGHQWTTWKAWYGDLSQLFHCFVHIPVFNYCQRRVCSRFVELDYDGVKEMFYDEDKEFWDEEQSLIKDQHDLISEERSVYDERKKEAIVFVRGAGTSLRV